MTWCKCNENNLKLLLHTYNVTLLHQTYAVQDKLNQ